MNSYVDDGWLSHNERASVTVHEETKSAKVTYPNQSGGRPFRVIVHQKPNPIGFGARLPGDKPRS